MKAPELDLKQQSIVTVAAFTAGGDAAKLEGALNEGLDAGLSVSEIKDVLVQMYAYAGFPRSLNGISTLMGVLDARRKKGIEDAPGKEASPLPTDKTSLELGTENQTKLIGKPATGAYMTFAPVIDQFLKAHLFGDIFGRDVLDFKTRELATVAALANLPGAEGQLEAHFGLGLHTGLTEAQMDGLLQVIATKVSRPQADEAARVLAKVLKKEAPPAAQRMVRLARLKIHSEHLASYEAALKEEINASLRLEPGVLGLRALSDKKEPTRITIVETYADVDAYQAHLVSPHFQRYKAATEHMIESLELAEVDSLLFNEK